MLRFFIKTWSLFNQFLGFLAPFGDLVIRIWVARIFFSAGLTKISTWETTKLLFTYEYSVPLLPPVWAAVLGTATELSMPVLLVFGLFGRFPAFILFIFNAVAVYSYPYLLTKEGAVGLNDHICWGFLLMVIMLHSPGKIALDRLFTYWYRKYRA